MARLFIDGFEHGDALLWDSDIYHLEVSENDDITGNYLITNDGDVTNGYVNKTISAKTTVYVAARFRVNPVNALCTGRLYFYYGAVEVGYFTAARSNGTWAVSFYSNGSTVWSGTSSSADELHVQVKLEYGSPTWAVTIKINNVEVCSAVSCSSDAYLNITKIRLYLATTSGVIGGVIGEYMYADDIVIDDSDWPGSPFIYGLTPTGDGATTEWDPSTGTDHYPLVDEIPASSTDYVSSTTSGEVELYTFSNLPDTDVWSVNSVQVSAYAKTPGPPEDEYLQLGVRHAGANYFGAPVQLSTDFTQHATIFENNPLTGSAWTQDDVHSGEFGFKEVS